MKRANNLLDKILTNENIEQAYVKSKRGLKARVSIEKFEKNIECNIYQIKRILNLEEPLKFNYITFKIKDPKPREINSTSFLNRVIQHSIINICEPIFEKHLIFHSYASRKDKGVHKAIKYLSSKLKSSDYFLKLDVRKYFNSIDHFILKNQLYKSFKDKVIINLFYQIIDSFQANDGYGLPLGNLTSQYFANHYLSDMDHYAKEVLKCRIYIRYMDDIVIVHNNRSFLRQIADKLKTYAEGLLKIEFKHIIINKIQHGIPFLGYLVFYKKINLLQAKKRKYIKKLKLYNRFFLNGLWTEGEYSRHITSLSTHIAFTGAKVSGAKWAKIAQLDDFSSRRILEQQSC